MGRHPRSRWDASSSGVTSGDRCVRIVDLRAPGSGPSRLGSRVADCADRLKHELVLSPLNRSNAENEVGESVATDELVRGGAGEIGRVDAVRRDRERRLHARRDERQHLDLVHAARGQVVCDREHLRRRGEVAAADLVRAQSRHSVDAELA
jgi:hypothetical protein